MEEGSVGKCLAGRNALPAGDGCPSKLAAGYHWQHKRRCDQSAWEGVTVQIGDMAPEFSLKGPTGPGLDLKELRGKGRAALFFYPADRTPG